LQGFAVRKADFGIGTSHEVSSVKDMTICSCITDRLGLTKEIAPTIQDLDAEPISFP
jgi:hypothetical protein